MSNKQKNIIFAIEYAIAFISVLAALFALLSVVGMIEAMSITAATLRVFIPCVAWLAVVGFYVHRVNK